MFAAQNEYQLDIEQLKMSINNQSVSVVVGSNPRNPTGTVIKGDQMKELVDLARDGTTLVLDELYDLSPKKK